jgi:hypothetical protein
MDSWAIPGRLSPPSFRNVSSVSSLLSVFLTKRIKYYRNETDPTCLLCGAAEENVLHFILQCEKLQAERVALLSEINAIWQNKFQNNENFTDLSEVDQLQLLMDNTIKAARMSR